MSGETSRRNRVGSPAHVGLRTSYRDVARHNSLKDPHYRRGPCPTVHVVVRNAGVKSFLGEINGPNQWKNVKSCECGSFDRFGAMSSPVFDDCTAFRPKPSLYEWRPLRVITGGMAGGEPHLI